MIDRKKRIEDYDEEKSKPHYLFHEDGTPHYRKAETGCCDGFGEVCEACGGFCHYQPVYGGYYYKCEDCLKTQ
jgi:hypothetical protein